MGQPLSVVSDPSAHQRVVALTLEAKEIEAPGLVMAFAMFGLPAIAGMLKVPMLFFVQQQNCLPSLLSYSVQFCATAAHCVGSCCAGTPVTPAWAAIP